MMPERPMDHDKLTEFLDGELSKEERARFEAHLASCPDCRRTVESWRKASRAFFQASPLPTAAERELFVRRVMARLPAEEDAAPWRWLVPALGFSFALFLLSFLPAQQEQTDPLKTLLLADASAQSADPLDVLAGLGDER